jgi:hypothetical protein
MAPAGLGTPPSPGCTGRPRCGWCTRSWRGSTGCGCLRGGCRARTRRARTGTCTNVLHRRASAHSRAAAAESRAFPGSGLRVGAHVVFLLPSVLALSGSLTVCSSVTVRTPSRPVPSRGHAGRRGVTPADFLRFRRCRSAAFFRRASHARFGSRGGHPVPGFWPTSADCDDIRLGLVFVDSDATIKRRRPDTL